MVFHAKCTTSDDDTLTVTKRYDGSFSVRAEVDCEEVEVYLAAHKARELAHWLLSELGEGAPVEATPKGGAAFAKAGEIVRIGGLIGETDKANRALVPMHGKSSSVEFGKADAVRLVSLIEGPDVVHVMKVLAVVSRSARIEE